MRLTQVCRRIAALIVVFAIMMSLSLPAAADELGSERGRMKDIAKQVAKELEKNYYDPKMNGMDWPALLNQTRERIEGAKSVGEMITSIFIMVDKLKDSHTFFIPPARATSYKYGFEAKAFGNEARIYELKKNGAAMRAGLKIGDRILKINGHPAERGSFDLMMLDMRRLRPVIAMDLVVQADGEEPRNVRLEPIKDAKPTVLDAVNRLGDIWDLIVEDENAEEIWHSANYDGGIGYIQIREFLYNSEFLDGMYDKVKGSKAIIVDMRGNPGGVQDTLKSFSGLFQSAQSEMGKVEYRNKTEPLIIKARKGNFTGPMFILIDSRSGSAAEMFAKHFQLSKRAVIIGDHSPGRVNSARIFSEEVGTDRVVPYNIEIAMGKVVMADGQVLEKTGVAPDQFCLPTGKDLFEERDTCLHVAVAAARKALDLPVVDKVSVKMTEAGKN
ncbi:MAG: peptidase [Acidobacteriales bacterium]|nr:peptidase [Terriglobales bacterium]